jgi:hypothetical protein
MSRPDYFSIFGSGTAISERVLAANFFKESQRVGVYIHCAALREVDTSQLVSEVTHAGTASCKGLTST